MLCCMRLRSVCRVFYFFLLRLKFEHICAHSIRIVYQCVVQWTWNIQIGPYNQTSSTHAHRSTANAKYMWFYRFRNFHIPKLRRKKKSGTKMCALVSIDKKKNRFSSYVCLRDCNGSVKDISCARHTHVSRLSIIYATKSRLCVAIFFSALVEKEVIRTTGERETHRSVRCICVFNWSIF